MSIELKNVKIGGKNFSGRNVGEYKMGRFFTVVLSPKDAKELENLGCLVRKMERTGTKYVMAKIPNQIKYSKMSIRLKIRGEDDIVLDPSSIGVLDWVTINKADIKVDVFKPANMDKSVLFLRSMEAHINKNVTTTITDFIPIAEQIRSQSYKECIDNLKNIVNNLDLYRGTN